MRLSSCSQCLFSAFPVLCVSATEEWDDVRSLISGMEGRRVRLAGEHTHEEHQDGLSAKMASSLSG